MDKPVAQKQFNDLVATLPELPHGMLATSTMNGRPPRNDRRDNRPERAKVQWNVAKTFSDPKSGVAVIVSKSVGINPLFSFQVGRVRDDGFVNTNLQFRTQRNIATFELEVDYLAILPELLRQAQEFAVLDMQWNFAQRSEQQFERDSRRDGGGNKAKQFVRAPGKTARDKAKKAGIKKG